MGAAGAAVAAASDGAPVAQQATTRASAPQRFRPVLVENFDHGLSPRRWGRYSGHPGGDPGGFWHSSHVVVRDGVLRLETYRDPRFGGHWVSGGVSSAPALKQTYGRYRVRMRVDRGHGVAAIALLWPAADRWPPEIDFAENGGAQNRRDSYSATVHHGRRDRQIQRTVRADLSRWHTIGVEWTPGRIAYTLDGRTRAVVRRHVPAQRMELDLQTQAGTCGDEFAPCPDASTPARVTTEVDWVRVDAYHSPGRRR